MDKTIKIILDKIKTCAEEHFRRRNTDCSYNYDYNYDYDENKIDEVINKVKKIIPIICKKKFKEMINEFNKFNEKREYYNNDNNIDNFNDLKLVRVLSLHGYGEYHIIYDNITKNKKLLDKYKKNYENDENDEDSEENDDLNYEGKIYRFYYINKNFDLYIFFDIQLESIFGIFDEYFDENHKIDENGVNGRYFKWLHDFFNDWNFFQIEKLYSNNNEIMCQNTLKNEKNKYHPNIFKNSNKNIYYELYVNPQKYPAFFNLDHLLLDRSKIKKIHNNNGIITNENVIELKNDVKIIFSSKGSKTYDYDCFDNKYNNIYSEFPGKVKDETNLYKIFKNDKLVSGFNDSGYVYGLGDRLTKLYEYCNDLIIYNCGNAATIIIVKNLFNFD